MRYTTKQYSAFSFPNSEFRIPHLREFRIPQSRRAFSLAEVLISMFVLAIGMMGILALFPLGAAQMAQAVKDERCAQLADIQEGMARIYRRDAYLNTDGTLKTDAQINAQYAELKSLESPQVLASSSGPSVPVLVDPIGQPYLGNAVGTTGVRSSITVSGAYGISIPQRIRLFALLDDISFSATGTATTPVNRGNRYNASWMLQRPKNNVRHEINLTVVVYQGRPPADTPPTETSLGVASMSEGYDFISLTSAPTLRKGSWILLTPTTLGSAAPFADFYRIVGSSGTTVSVSPPIRHYSVPQAHATVLENVAEVFDRGTITPYEVPAP